MGTRKVKDALNLETGEKIYLRGHAQATYMSDGRTVEDAINGSSGSSDIYKDLDITKERFAELLNRDFYCPQVDSEPTEETLTYVDTDGSIREYQIGQLCRVPAGESAEYALYQFLGSYQGKAGWMKVSQVIANPEEESYIDLSRQDIYGKSIAQTTANCYVVNKTGNYMFPIAYGAAIKNGVSNPKAYTRIDGTSTGYFVNYKNTPISSPYIEVDTGVMPASVELTMCDEPGLMNRLKIKSFNGVSYVVFTLNKVPVTGANAVVSVLDEVGDVMWSWHIWVWADDLSVETITNTSNLSYNILPVNLGSKWDDSSKTHIKNWYYQWGRPTPMICPLKYDSSEDSTNYGIREFVKESSPAASYGAAIRQPNKFFGNSATPFNWVNIPSYYNLWDARNTTVGNSDVKVVKTVYDPSPVGFAVPNGNVFTGFSLSNVVGEFDGGWNFKRNPSDTAGVFFPANGSRGYADGDLGYVGTDGSVWLSSAGSDENVFYLMYNSTRVEPQYGYYRAYGRAVRPVQEASSDNIKKTVIHIDQSISDPATMVTRTVNEGGIEAIRANSHRYTGSLNSSGVMELRQLDDNDGTKYLDGTDAVINKQFIDVWMKLPVFYWKCENLTADLVEISFAYGEMPEEDGWNIWDGRDLIGVYEANHPGGNALLSYSVGMPKVSADRDTFKIYARGRGDGYTLIKWKHHCMMAVLFYAQYTHTDSQSLIGGSSYVSSKALGQTNRLGMEDTVASVNGNSQSVNFWGLEAWWNGYKEYLDDVDTKDFIWYIKEDDGTDRNIGEGAGDGYISKMMFGEKMDLKPTSVNGSGTSGFCDYSLRKNGGTVIWAGARGGYTYSSNSNHGQCGISYVDTFYSSTYVGSDVTSRLAYRGEHVII